MSEPTQEQPPPDIPVNDPPKMEKGTVSESAKGTLSNVIGGLLPGILGVIGALIRFIAVFIYYILFKVIPFLVFYFGIPMFILGAIMAIMFMGGHILFVIVFFTGTFIYIKKLIKAAYKLPKPKGSGMVNNIAGKVNNVGSKIKF